MRAVAITVVMFTTYALFAAAWVAGAIMAPQIQAELSAGSFSAAAWANNAITIAKIIGNLMAAWLMLQLGIKRAFTIAALLIVAGGASALATDYSLYVLGRLVLGLGGALVIVYFAPLVVHYVATDKRPLVNGINAAAFNTGNLLALLATVPVLTWLGSWQAVLVALALVSLVMVVVWQIVGEDFALANTPATEKGAVKEGLKTSLNYWLPLGYTGILFCYIAVFTIFPNTDSFAIEGRHLSMLMIAAGMVGTVLGILITQRLPNRVTVIKGFALVTPVAMAVAISTDVPVIAYSAAVIAGIAMFAPMTALVTLPQEMPNVSPASITVTFAMFWSISYGLETILMTIAGYLADQSGNWQSAAWMAVISSASLFVFSFMLPEPNKLKHQEA